MRTIKMYLDVPFHVLMNLDLPREERKNLNYTKQLLIFWYYIKVFVQIGRPKD